jgi:cyclopropane-fatty-acyl-phospholipid synthase
VILRSALALAERGHVPLPLLRYGIRRLLRERLEQQRRAPSTNALIQNLRASPIALQPERANDQHYEVPAAFFRLVLGPRLKYSGAYWPDGTSTLADAEARMLQLTCERARLADGQSILELGCGWGSLSLYLAEHYPNSRIVAVSNSVSQRRFIEAQAPPNLRIITADMNAFETAQQFDRVVSVEMLEHMRNYGLLLRRIAAWLEPAGSCFVHVFCHRAFAYPFEASGDGDWMGRHFFTGGLMPSLDLLPAFNDDLGVAEQWTGNGTHYQRTAAAWRRNLEANRGAVMEVLRTTYSDDAARWFHRWRLFFLACEELFGYRRGTEWLVAHYRFVPQTKHVSARAPHAATAAAPQRRKTR